MTQHEIVVIGGGNAALCAAITAAEAGARVLILETAPKPYRGGNSRHTRNFRCMHQGPLDPLTDSYSEGEYLDDLLKVTGGKTDEQLALLLAKAPVDEIQGYHFARPNDAAATAEQLSSGSAARVEMMRMMKIAKSNSKLIAA